MGGCEQEARGSILPGVKRSRRSPVQDRGPVRHQVGPSEYTHRKRYVAATSWSLKCFLGSHRSSRNASRSCQPSLQHSRPSLATFPPKEIHHSERCRTIINYSTLTYIPTIIHFIFDRLASILFVYLIFNYLWSTNTFKGRNCHTNI